MSVILCNTDENPDKEATCLNLMADEKVSGVILSADTTDPFARRVVRGSRGAIFTVPICIYPDAARAIVEARTRGIQVVATSAGADAPYTGVDYTVPTMLIVGSEHFGISDVVRDLADTVVRIPMLGKINSLNISVAASVLLYEALRQRRATESPAASPLT